MAKTSLLALPVGACRDSSASPSLAVPLVEHDASPLRDAWSPSRAATDDELGEATAAALALRTGRFCTMLDNILFAAVIPESLELVARLGGSATTSGFVISIQKAGYFVGSVPVFVALRLSPDLWRSHAQLLYFLYASCSVVGSLVYAAVAFSVSEASVASALGQDEKRWLLLALLSARFCCGCGAGVRLMVSRSHVGRLCPREDRPAEQAKYVFSGMLGMGLGPTVAAAVKLACSRHEQDFLPVGLLVFALSLCQMGMALRLRSLANAKDHLRQDEASQSSTGEVSRRLLITGFCLAFVVLRPMTTSSLATATVMLLETEYELPVQYCGLAVGATFLSCLPLRLAFDSMRQRYSTTAWIRRLALLALLGSTLLLPFWDYLGAATWSVAVRNCVGGATLLLADAIVFPCFWFADGLVQGVLMQYPLPHGHILDPRGVTFVLVLMVDGIGNPLGPPLARYRLSHGGQLGYAVQQLFLCAIGLLVSWVGLSPLVEKNASQSG